MRTPGSQQDLPACRDGRIIVGFPPPARKGYLDTLQPGETGYYELCKEAPAGQNANLLVESNSWFTQPELDTKFAIWVYFTGNPR